MTISVASYNIRKSVGTDWRRRPERVLKVIREIGADVIALQEVDRRFGRRSSSLSVNIIGLETDHRVLEFEHLPKGLGWHGNTMLIRADFELLDQRGLDLPGLEPRGAAMAVVRIDGRPVRIIGTHLGLLRNWRRRQAQALLAHLDGFEHRIPTIVMGDLNEWGDHGCIADFKSRLKVTAPGHTYHSERPFVAFDRIMTSDEWSVEGAGVHHSESAVLASDHLPVWARLRLTG